METKKITEESIIVISMGDEPVAIVRRQDKSGHQLIYRLVETDGDSIKDIIK